MSEIEEGAGDATVDGAWAYERLHVEALFSQWTQPILAAAGVASGDAVLDVACGTGVLARAALQRVGATGSVTGVDIDLGMLEVARVIEPDIDWREGNATALQFADEEFDHVVSQFGLMFFPDRVRAIGEMLRCVKPEGRVVVAVWGSLEAAEAYPTTVDLFGRLIGPDAADALRAPFVLGDADELRGLFDKAGSEHVSIDTRMGRARFPSVRSLVEADLRGWLHLMGVAVDEDTIEHVLAEADEALGRFVTADGSTNFRIPAHIVTARR